MCEQHRSSEHGLALALDEVTRLYSQLDMLVSSQGLSPCDAQHIAQHIGALEDCIMRMTAVNN